MYLSPRSNHPTNNFYNDPTHQGNSQQLLEHPPTIYQAHSNPCTENPPKSVGGTKKEKKERGERSTKASTHLFLFLPSSKHPRIVGEHPPRRQRGRGGSGEENTPKEPLTYSLNRQLVRLRVLDTICPCVLHKTHHILHLTLRNPEAPTYRC